MGPERASVRRITYRYYFYTLRTYIGIERKQYDKQSKNRINGLEGGGKKICKTVDKFKYLGLNVEKSNGMWTEVNNKNNTIQCE